MNIAKRTRKLTESVMKEEELNLKRYQTEMKKNHADLDQQINVSSCCALCIYKSFRQ